jgi:predicted type IV restriction endonuclease
MERKGFWQAGRSIEGGYCVLTAIDSSEENKERRDHAIKRVCKNLGLSEDDFGAIATWNDQRERTKNEVVAKLRAVALGL